MTGEISNIDIKDSDIIDQYELSSDGYTSYRSINILNISVSKIITISPSNSLDTLSNLDLPVEVGDYVRITGNSSTGTYTISSIINSLSFTVIEPIVSSSGGIAWFIYPPGAKRIAWNPSKQINPVITATNVQDAITQISDNTLSVQNHELLDTLTHDIAEDGYGVVSYLTNSCHSLNYISNYTIWSSINMIKKIREFQIYYTNKQISQVISIQYNPSGDEISRLVENIAYANKNLKTITSFKII